MKKLETLSPEQRKLMEVVRDEWINHAMTRNGEIDEKAFSEGISWLYTELLNKPIPKIVYCDSWLSCLITIAIMKNANTESVWESVRDSVENNVWGSVADSVLDNVENNVWGSVLDNVENNVAASVLDNVENNVWGSVRDSVENNVWGNVENNVWGSVRDSVENNVWGNVENNVAESVLGIVRSIFNDRSSYIGYSNYGWVAFYDFFGRIGTLKNPKFNEYLKLTKSGVFECYEYENIAFAIRPPLKILRNDSGQLHSIDQSSVAFKDNSQYFFVNGREIPESYFFAIKNKSFTLELFSKESNEEYKSTCIALMQELYGDEYLFDFFRKFLNEVDTYIDEKNPEFLHGTTNGMNVGVYTLFSGKINGEPIAYVRCFCPSTDRMFFLGVDPVNTNAKDAIASLYRVPKKLKGNIKYIQRQGERFSTVFDEAGTQLLRTKSLSQKDISDTTTISGQQYFSLLKFEY